MSEPTPPPDPSPVDAPADPPPAPRLWRGEDSQGRVVGRRRSIWPAVAAIAAVVGIAGLMLSWVRRAPTLEFIPVWASGADVRLSVRPIAEAGSDLQAFTMVPARNPLANALAARGTAPRGLGEALAALEATDASDTLVVYLCARAVRGGGPEVTVQILPNDTGDGLGRRTGWIELREVLRSLAGHPAAHKLLLLDLHPVVADPRVGFAPDDLAAGVREELARFPANPCLVITNCDVGQEPLASEALGRTVFSFYLEEGLRGWADVSADGRITVRELAAYLRERVERWALRTRGVRQTPVLHAPQGIDFPLLVLDRAGPKPHMVLREPKALPAYPDWLVAGWKLRDVWLADHRERDAPRLTAALELALLDAERDWRGGLDPAKVRVALDETIERLTRKLDAFRDLPHPAPASLALEEAFGRTPDPAVKDAVSAALAKRTPPAPDAKPGEAEAADARLIADLFAGLKTAGDFDVAAAVFAAAAELPEPSRDALAFLDQIIRIRLTRRPYAELAALHDLAALPAEGWSPEVVHMALEVLRRGELAASRPAAFAWVRALLDPAERQRHEGILLLRARGFASLDAARTKLREADVALAEVVTASQTIERVRHALDDGLVLLTESLRYVEQSSELEDVWSEAVQAADDVIQILAQEPPALPPAARVRIDAIEARGEVLLNRLAALRRPFSPERLARLSAPALNPSPRDFTEIEELLETVLPDASERPKLWAALRDMDLRLNASVLVRDAREGRTLPRDSAGGAVETEESPRHSQARLVRRAARGSALLALVDAEDARPGTTDILTSVRGWFRLPARVEAERDLPRADLMARLASPLVASPRLDDPATNPTRLLRIAKFNALRLWLAERYQHLGRDLDGSPFFSAVAEVYRQAGDPPQRRGITATVEAAGVTLDPTHPAVQVPVRFRYDGPPAEAVAQVQVLTADGRWLEVRRGSPWPSARSPFPVVETSPLAFDLTLASGEPVEAPLEIRLRPEDDGPRPPVPAGVLLRERVHGWTYHQLLPLRIEPASRQLRIVLSASAARPEAPVGELRLHPTPDPTAYHLYVENPSEADRSLLVQLRDGSAIVPGCEAAATVKAGGFAHVAFGPPAAKPETDVYEVHGPLTVRLLDAADPTKVVLERTLPATVAAATDYVRVVEARYEPTDEANEGKSKLSFRVRAAAPIVGPPVTVELSLTPDRVPGLVSPGEGTFRVELAKEGDEAVVFAEGIKLDEREDEEGHADLAVDGVARALTFRTTFARRGDATTPRLDRRPAIRIVAPATAYAGAPLDAALAIDNAPVGASYELQLGRYGPGGFQVDQRRDGPAARETIRVAPRGPDGALRFQAEVRDPILSLDVRRIRGRRELRARLDDAEGETRATDSLAVLFDDRPPAGVKITEVPRYVLKGAPFEVRANGAPPGAGIQKVLMFIGKPVDGKLPPNAATVEAKPVDAARTVWAAKLSAPDAKGKAEVSVQFVSGVGLSAFDTATTEVVETMPVAPARIEGTVVEGDRPQAGLDVALFDAGNAEVARVVSDDNGRFAFPDLKPGAYKVYSVKPTPPTRGLKPAEAAAGKTVEVTVEMVRTPIRAAR